MFKVYIIGAGQIGSRHLQALKGVKTPLGIVVVDPSKESLGVAAQRYNQVPSGRLTHTVNYLQQVPNNQNVDLAIIATTSNIRAQIIRSLVKTNRVRYLILEKLLLGLRLHVRQKIQCSNSFHKYSLVEYAV